MLNQSPLLHPHHAVGKSPSSQKTFSTWIAATSPPPPNRKRRKLNARLQSLRLHNPSSAKIKQLEDQIRLICFDIKNSHNAEQTRQEKLAVAKVIEIPRFFFSYYAKRFSKQKSNVGPLYNNDSLTNNPSEMANILQKQYESVLVTLTDMIRSYLMLI